MAKNRIFRITILIFMTAFLISIINSYGQDKCEVLIPDLSGEYEGECKKGLAHGNGKAVGKDSYEGEFKKGLPNGKGIYTWSTGEIFDGEWKKGLRNGYGEYKFRAGTADTVRTGYWEDDKYIGIHEKPYKVTYTTTDVKTVRFLKLDDVGDQVELVFKQGGKEDNNVLSLILDGSSGNQEITMPSPSKFMNIMFPFKGEMSYTTIPQTSAYGGTGGTRIYCQVKFEIYEKGIWRVTVTM